MWTPWRMAYIMGKKPAGCLLCSKWQRPAQDDRENYILYRGEHCYIMLNLYPYTNGHLMVAPYVHEACIERLDDETLHQLMAFTRAGTAALRKAMSPDGFNMGINEGKVAGAGVADHIHMHVVPRWEGDTNFLSVLAEVRLVPETLDATYERLLPALEEALSR